MPRSHRLHVPGGMYYVLHLAAADSRLFRNLADFAEFQAILADGLRRYATVLHAFAWLPAAVHLIVQPGAQPVSNLMRTLCSRYVQRYRRSQGMFGGRPEMVLFDPEHLCHLVRYVHLKAISETTNTSEPPASTSHPAYLGQIRVPWLTTKVTLERFSSRPVEARRLYRKFMQERVGTPCADGTALLPKHGIQVLGGSSFLASLPRHMSVYRSTMTLDDVIAAVLLQEGLEREDVFARSGRHTHTSVVLARSLIAFHAVERNIATYAEIAKLFGIAASTLAGEIKSYRMRHSELFRREGLRNAGPLLPLPR